MTFSVILTLNHKSFDKPVEHIDMMHGSSLNAVLKQFVLTNDQVCEIKNSNMTSWKDKNDVEHTLEVKREDD